MPRRIRLVAVTRPGISKDTEPTPTNSASSSGGGKQIDDKKVGKVTLRLNVIGRSLSMPGEPTSTPTGAQSSAVVFKHGSNYAEEENVETSHIPGGIHFGRDTSPGSDPGQGMMGLLTAESPVREEAVAAGPPAGDVGSSYQASLDLELGEIPENEAAADQARTSQVFGQAMEDHLFSDAHLRNVSDAGGVEKKTLKETREEKKERKNKEKKHKDKKHKDKDRKHRDKKEKERKDKKRKHHKEHGDNANGTLSGPSTAIESEPREKRRRLEPRAGEHEIDAELKMLQADAVEFGLLENNDTVKTSTLFPPQPSNAGGGSMKLNINPGEGVLKLKIKKSKTNS